MSKEPLLNDQKKSSVHKPELPKQTTPQKAHHPEPANPLIDLQHQVGNRAVQRLVAQRESSEGENEVDEETAADIDRARGGGQSLDATVQKKMSQSMGQNFGNVRVHTGREAHSLNQKLNAKAFTTGHDIFFKEGAYNPNSSHGQELIAHELTHVVQQSSGEVHGGAGMSVNQPGDAFEQEADSVAKAVVNQGTGATPAREEEPEGQNLQRQPEEEEEEELQMQPEEEEEELQMQPEEEEEEEIMAMRQEEEEEEEIMAMRQEELPEEEI